MNEFDINIITNKSREINYIFNKSKELFIKDKRTIILFGAGKIGLVNLKYFRKYEISNELIFCDNDPKRQGTLINGIPVISFYELINKYKNSYIVITSQEYHEEILLQLKENNLYDNIINPLPEQTFVVEDQFYEDYVDYYNIICENKHKFTQLFSVLSDYESKMVFYNRLNYCISANSKYLIPMKSKNIQYFDAEVFRLTEEEILIDGGAFTGDTVEAFLQQTNGEYSKIYSFEPEIDKHSEFLNKYSIYSNIELVPLGLWRKTELLKFYAENNSSSKVSDYGNIEIPVTSIDEFLNGRPATLIKMDIEGAEFDALKGAEKTIKKYKPKLAICVYHNPLDIVNIPLYIKELVPEYKIFLRHYSESSSETVCYAIPDTSLSGVDTYE